MGVELSSEADLSRRIDARRLSQRSYRERCKRCRKKIPQDRRIVSLYCSVACHNNYNWEQRKLLRAEIRATMRALLAPTHCDCGELLNNQPGRPGKIAQSCRKCRNRRDQRNYAARKRSFSQE